MQIVGREYAISGRLAPDGDLVATIDGVQWHATVVQLEGTFHVFLDGESYVCKWIDPLAFDVENAAGENSLVAPIPGLLRALLVEPGQDVEKGAPLLVLEAMKMEYTIAAPAAGKVQTFFFAVGDQVSEGVQLLQFERSSTGGAGGDAH